MIKGTRILMDEEARIFTNTIDILRSVVINLGYKEIILPSLWEQQTFIDKAGPEIVNQMYAFNDKADRPICLIPEATAIIESLYKESWSKSLPKPIRLFYVQRCYRYEKPQSGRYREFTQFGVELLGSKENDKDEILSVLKKCLNKFNIEYDLNPLVKRGLHYYIEDGFEVECLNLGSQKQIAGGGRYSSGIGFGIGVDRLILSQNKKD